MDWPYCDGKVTVVDVLDGGACIDGVLSWVEKHRKIAGAVEEVGAQHSPRVKLAANGYGDGDGDGDGDGCAYA
jgi:hypothetical protein